VLRAGWEDAAVPLLHPSAENRGLSPKRGQSPS